MLLEFQNLAALFFIVVLSVVLYLKREKLTVHGSFPYFYFSMYKTQLGISFMQSLAKKWNKTLKVLGYIGIAAGFLGMVAICAALIHNLFVLFTRPEAVPGVGLVLPFKAKGVFYVPFFYWIISIFVIAVVHEVAHGVISKAHKIKVKTSGFAFLGTSYMIGGIAIILFALYAKMKSTSLDLASGFTQFNPLQYSFDAWILIGLVFVVISFIRNFPLPIIPAAFVEPDEKVLKKRPMKEQLSVFAAGPFSNVLLGLIFLGLSFALVPFAQNVFLPDGIGIDGFLEYKE